MLSLISPYETKLSLSLKEEKTMSGEDLYILKLTEKHLEQYNDLLRYAFQVTEKQLLDIGWESDEIRQAKAPVLKYANVIGYFDEDTLVSQFAVYPAKMNVHSTVVDTGFITSVTTYPEYSGLGLMSKLMKQALTEMKDSGQSVALLFPYSIPLYRKKGWEIISDKMSFSARIDQLLNTFDAPGYVRRKPFDSNDLTDLYTKFARQTHGCILRSQILWEEYWRWDVDDTIAAIYYDTNDTPLGYIVYRINNDVMFIKEMIYLNFEARNGLYQYIAAHESMIDEVKGYNYTSVPIAFSLPDSDIKETIRPYIMGRIVDFSAFIAKYKFDSSASGKSITFNIEDPLLEWNNKSFTVAIENGICHLTKDASKYTANLSIGTLTTLLMGYKRASYMAKLGMIDAETDTIKLLDRIIVNEKPYISDFI